MTCLLAEFLCAIGAFLVLPALFALVLVAAGYGL